MSPASNPQYGRGDAGLTVGIPVFNEARFIEAAIRSAASQSLRVLVADNASTDGSYELSARVADELPNVEVVRHASNIGASRNFKWLLDQANTDYFMWLGAHDALPADYAQNLIKALEERPQAVLAYGNAVHVDSHGRFISRYCYDFSPRFELESARDRVWAAIRFLDDCSLLHGVFRTRILRAAWVDASCLGLDHVLLARAAALGRWAHVPSTHLFRRDVHPEDSHQEQAERIRGEIADATPASYREMSVALVRLAIEHSGKGMLSQMIEHARSRAALAARFGPYSTGRFGTALDKYAFAPAFRLLSPWLDYLGGTGR